MTMESINYSNAFSTLWTGTCMLSSCMYHSFKVNAKDILRCAGRHYITTALLILIYATMFGIMGQARKDRDIASEQAVHFKMRTDSLEAAFLK